MSIPLIDSRTKEDILEEIGRRAPYYTPEWRYHPEDPDAGTALAFIWANMMSGIIDRYNRVLENYRRVLLDAVGSEPLPPLPAQGYLCFTPHKEAGFIVVPAGSGASAPDNPEAALVTERETAVSAAKITGLFYTDPDADICKRYESMTNITLFESVKSGAHIWTFEHPFAFDVSGGAALKLEISSSAMLTGAGVYWQFKLDDEWHDFTYVEPLENTITLRLPNEQTGICTSIRFILAECPELREQTLSGIGVFPSGAQLIPEAIYAGDTQAPDTGFYPFDRRFMPYNSFYLSCREALSKPGAVVELSFDLRTEEIAIEGYPQPEIHWKRVMKPGELQPPETFEIAIADTAWEYFNGTGWNSLPIENKGKNVRTVFATEQKTLIHYTLSFICPSDIAPTVWGAHDTLFIRARIVGVDNLFRTNGHYLTPWLERPRFRYYYKNSIRLAKALVAENLDTHEVSLTEPIELSGRIYEKPAVYLAFSHPFADGSILLQLTSGANIPKLAWEYYSEDGWITLDVHDETNGLSKTGIVFYHASIPASKLRLMGLDAWWMRIANISPRYDVLAQSGVFLQGIYENAATAQARVPGKDSNLSAGAYQTMLSSIPGIAAVVNPLSSHGGCAGESEDRIITRLSEEFNHGDRVISRADVESLARKSSLQILRCRFFPFTNLMGDASPGDSCLVVLREGGASRQDDFSLLSEQIGSFLADRRLPAFSFGSYLHIIEPHFIQVNITLHGGIAEITSALTIKADILKALESYLDPLGGGENGDGWQIGELPSPSRITLMLREATKLAYIRTLSVKYTMTAPNGIMTMNYTDATSDRFSLPGNGIHGIFLEAV